MQQRWIARLMVALLLGAGSPALAQDLPGAEDLDAPIEEDAPPADATADPADAQPAGAQPAVAQDRPASTTSTAAAQPAAEVGAQTTVAPASTVMVAGAKTLFSTRTRLPAALVAVAAKATVAAQECTSEAVVAPSPWRKTPLAV